MTNRLTIEALIKQSTAMSAKFDAVVSKEMHRVKLKTEVEFKTVLSACVMGISLTLAKQLAAMEPDKAIRDRLLKSLLEQTMSQADKLARHVETSGTMQ